MTDRNTQSQMVWDQQWSLDRSNMYLPGQADLEPPQAVIDFADMAILHFADRPANRLRALDLGSGMGRNSMYLAQKFGSVVGIDYSRSAVEQSKRLADTLDKSIDFVQADAIGELPFPNDTFDLIIDSFTSTSIQGSENRELFAKECERLLTPQGLLLMRSVSTEDITESRLIKSNPGPDVNSSIWPGTNKFQKNYSAAEILELHNGLELIRLEKQRKYSYKLGMHVPVTNWMAVFEKGATSE